MKTMNSRLVRLFGCVLYFLLIILSVQANELKLESDTFRLTLAVSEHGTPVLKSAVWKDDQLTAFNHTLIAKMEKWMPGMLIDDDQLDIQWQRAPDEVFDRAILKRPLRFGLELEWSVELLKTQALFRMHVTLSNQGNEKISIPYYPGWFGNWEIPGKDRYWFDAWQALSYEPFQWDIVRDRAIMFQSRLHSSDQSLDGQNPYWSVYRDGDIRLNFSLEWCGGWKAQLNRLQGGLDFGVWLPREETQLVLHPGELVTGPKIIVVPTRGTDVDGHRADWIKQRVEMGRQVYGGPEPSFPMIYNTWYSKRWDIDTEYLQHQIDAIDEYGFDAFVVDAGWYVREGVWHPDPGKFPSGSFERQLSQVRAGKATVGIWSCPQFLELKDEALPDEIDRPGLYRPFLNAWLYDLVGIDFPDFLSQHMKQLRSRYSAHWWKYDQDFFAPNTRHGQMKNVLAVQDALIRVRKENPDLYIECCQSGGRMVNDLTTLSSQIHWLADGGGTGFGHAQSNIKEALGAIQVLPPWMAQRWTNNPQLNDTNDNELTRYYCRSCMIGTWGISADLPKIPARQKKIVLQEIGHYRRFNTYKSDLLYRFDYPDSGSGAVSICYYSRDGSRAAAIIYRWQDEGQVSRILQIPTADPQKRYMIELVDKGTRQTIQGSLLIDGLELSLEPERWSEMVFIDAI